MTCKVNLAGLDPDSLKVEVYSGKLDDTGKMSNGKAFEMSLTNRLENGDCEYETEMVLNNGGNYGYTFRVLPKNELLINENDLSLCTWLTN